MEDNKFLKIDLSRADTDATLKLSGVSSMDGESGILLIIADRVNTNLFNLTRLRKFPGLAFIPEGDKIEVLINQSAVRRIKII